MSEQCPIKITAVHLENEGAYIVNASGLWSYTVTCGGAPVKGEFVTQSLDDVEVTITKPGSLVHWADEFGNNLSPEDYAIERETLLSESHDCDGAPVFKSLEAEFAFRKFSARWSAVLSEPTTERVPISFDITEVRTSSGDPEILSMWNSARMDSDNKLYSVRRNSVAVRMLREACIRDGIAVEIPTHSGVRFAKIADSYAFCDGDEFTDRPFIGTLAQCRAEKRKISARIEAVVATHVAKLRGTQLTGVGEIVLQLEGVRHSLARVRPKQDTATHLRLAEKTLSELIARLQASLTKPTGE